MPDDVVLRLARRLSPNDAEATAASLRAASTFQGDLTWLERLFALSDVHPMPPVPEELTTALLAVAAPSQDDPYFEAGVPVEAIVIHDSRVNRQLVGVRGPDAGSDAGWTVIYSTPKADLLLDGTPRGAATAVRGHLLHRTGEQQACRIVCEQINREVFSDGEGVFDLGELDPQDHELRILSEGMNFSCQLHLP